VSSVATLVSRLWSDTCAPLCQKALDMAGVLPHRERRKKKTAVNTKRMWNVARGEAQSRSLEVDILKGTLRALEVRRAVVPAWHLLPCNASPAAVAVAVAVVAAAIAVASRLWISRALCAACSSLASAVLCCAVLCCPVLSCAVLRCQ
jgi:hypothetical protein